MLYDIQRIVNFDTDSFLFHYRFNPACDGCEVCGVFFYPLELGIAVNNCNLLRHQAVNGAFPIAGSGLRRCSAEKVRKDGGDVFDGCGIVNFCYCVHRAGDVDGDAPVELTIFGKNRF